MIVILYKLYLSELRDIERFADGEQDIGGVDDKNSINTLAQLARKLLDGGLTIPGNLNFKGTTMPLSILSGSASPDAYKFQFGDGTGWRLRFQKDDKSPTMDVFDNGNVTILGTVKAGTIISDGPLNLGTKFRLSGAGDGMANDDWLRMVNPADPTKYAGGFAAGKLWTNDSTINGRNIFAEIDDLKNNCIRKDRKYGIQSNRGGILSDRGGWVGAVQDWETMRFLQV